MKINNYINFISKLVVVSKPRDGVQRLIKLDPLFPGQKEVIERYFNHESLCVLKCRQIGFTTILAALFFTDAFFSTNPAAIGIVAHTMDLSIEVLDKIKIMWENLPEPIRKTRKVRITKTIFSFDDTKSYIEARGMDQPGGLRGKTYRTIGITEFSLARHPEELMRACLGSVNDGQIIVEGTAQYFGDGLYHQYLKAQDEESKIKPLFFSWKDHPEYTRESEDFTPTQDELNLQQEYNLTQGNLIWRRSIIKGKGLSEDSFNREYPLSFNLAYAQAPGSFIQQDYLNQISVIKSYADKKNIFQPPEPKGIYVIGFDPSGGSGKDYGSIHVLNARNYNLMACWYSNRIPTSQQADVAAELSAYYNGAKILFESGPHQTGGIVSQRLKELKTPMKYIKNNLWVTNSKTKAELLENLKQTIIRGSIKSLDEFTYNDLMQAKQDVDLKLLIDRNQSGSHFDGGISLSFACYAAKYTEVPREINSFWKAMGVEV